MPLRRTRTAPCSPTPSTATWRSGWRRRPRPSGRARSASHMHRTRTPRPRRHRMTRQILLEIRHQRTLPQPASSTRMDSVVPVRASSAAAAARIWTCVTLVAGRMRRILGAPLTSRPLTGDGAAPAHGRSRAGEQQGGGFHDRSPYRATTIRVCVGAPTHRGPAPPKVIPRRSGRRPSRPRAPRAGR